MNTELLTVLCRERRRAVREDYVRGDLLFTALRVTIARSLRASGEGLFRLGVALDERVPVASVGNARLMTTIGLVSDTHLPRFGRALPRALEDGFRAARVSRILHMGDLTDALAIPLLEALAPVDAVAGNNDPHEVWERYGRRKVLTIDGVRVGMIHGDEGRGRNAHENALAAFAADAPDVILYGHSHRPVVERRGNVLIANPGSPTDKRMMPQFSFGVLTIGNGIPAIALTYFGSREAR